MSASKLDAVYRSILLTKFFTKGWGKPENLRRLFEFRKVVSNRDECYKLVERDYPVTITKEQNLSDGKLIEGYFVTPLERYLPGIVPKIAQKAHFQAILPMHWPDKTVKPVCLHLAGTGDHFYWRRRNLMVKPLLKEASIGGIILENPFYGHRKPTDQIRSSLHNVSDIFVMGGCLILESLVLFHWCERNGLGPLGVTGLSMGGHMASLAATNWPKPLVLVPCLSWSTASAVFLQGVMSQSINWDMLEDQYLSDGVYREKLAKMVTIIDEAFLAGKKFARTYTQFSQNINANDKMNTDKNVDITYKEANNATDQVEDLSKKLELKSISKTVESDLVTELGKLRVDLKKLLDEHKISQVLYEKLTSNEKFVLDPQDIEDINKLSEVRIKEMLLKCKVASVKDEPLELYGNNNESMNNDLKPDTKYSSPLELKTNNAQAIPIMLNITKTTSTESLKSSTDSLKASTESLKASRESLKASTKSLKASTESLKASTESLKASTESLKASTERFKSSTNEKNSEDDKDKPKVKSSWNISDITPHWIDLSFLKSSEKKIDISKIHWRDREALQFMRGIMDECTHLSNFSVPFDTSLIIAVCAKHDAYVPREDVGALEEIWPGAEVRYVDAGHVSAYLLHQSLFRACIIEAFERSKKKWKDGKHIA